MSAHFIIPAGTLVEVSGGSGWRRHTTRKDLVFAGCLVNSFGRLIFKSGNWTIRVEKAKVRDGSAEKAVH